MKISFKTLCIYSFISLGYLSYHNNVPIRRVLFCTIMIHLYAKLRLHVARWLQCRVWPYGKKTLLKILHTRNKLTIKQNVECFIVNGNMICSLILKKFLKKISHPVGFNMVVLRRTSGTHNAVDRQPGSTAYHYNYIKKAHIKTLLKLLKGKDTILRYCTLFKTFFLF